VAYFAWLALGGIGTYVDKIHEHLGVVAYPDKTWVGEALPVSPVYLGASTLMFIVYTVVVGHRSHQQGLFGGRPLNKREVTYATLSWVGVYFVSGVCGSPLSGQPALPWLGAFFLAATAFPDLWMMRKTWLPLYALLVALTGVSFEWFATSHGAFAYPVCPSPVCLFTTVPALWLGFLYVHAALWVHRMLGGRHVFTRWLNRDWIGTSTN
jgi:hypothetical protein